MSVCVGTLLPVLCAKSLPFAALWTVTGRLLCPWGFSGQERWSGLPCPPPGSSRPGMAPASAMSPALAGGFFAVSTVWVLLVSINFHQSLLPLSSQAVVVYKASHQERGGAPRLSALLPICFLCLQALHLGGLAPGVRGWGIPTEWADLRGRAKSCLPGRRHQRRS